MNNSTGIEEHSTLDCRFDQNQMKMIQILFNSRSLFNFYEKLDYAIQIFVFHNCKKTSDLTSTLNQSFCNTPMTSDSIS